jgi:hypothetical protein
MAESHKMVLRRLRAALVLSVCSWLAAALFVTTVKAQATVTFDTQQRFQTFRAWEATVDLLGTPAQRTSNAKIYDSLFDDVGITRLRLEMFAGDENRTRSFQRYLAKEIDMKGWRSLRYATANDNDDPFQINWEGFDFADLDWRMDVSVLPMLERAKARRQKLDINLTYVAFTRQSDPVPYVHLDPEEYAEFILAAYLHLGDKYGVVPDDLEVLLEPDNARNHTPVTLGRAMAAVSKRLRHAGFAPRLIAPSTANAALALQWLDGIASVPGATDDLAELSYHRYKGAKPPVLAQIGARAKALGLQTGMLEYWFGKATYQLLHDDLKIANVSSWQGRSVYTFHKIAADGSITLADDIRYNRLYFNAIRPGMVRIGAASTVLGAIDPVAFVDASGRMAVVMRAGRAATVTLQGLPKGSYWLETAYIGGGTAAPVSFQVGDDGKFATEIPAAGVISLRPEILIGP